MFTHSSVEGCLVVSTFLAIANNAHMNIHVCEHVYLSLESPKVTVEGFEELPNCCLEWLYHSGI